MKTIPSIRYFIPSSALAICLLLTQVTVGQESHALEADRPGFSTGTHAAAPGVIYLEWGYRFSFNPRTPIVPYSNLPELNIRVGIFRNLELSLSWDGWNISHPALIEDSTPEHPDKGISVPDFGFKYKLTDSDLFALTLMGNMQTSSRDDKISLDPHLALLFDFQLHDDVKLYGMSKAGLSNQEDDRVLDSAFALGIEYSLSDKMGIFSEFYRSYVPGIVGFGNEAGFTYLITNDLQIDIYAGYGINKAIDHYIGAGIAKRILRSSHRP
jgi:hypothetical protein